MLLIGLMAIGGSIGSTAGGIKIFRASFAEAAAQKSITRTTLRPNALSALGVHGERTEPHVHLTGELRMMHIPVGDDTAGKTPADLRLDGSAKVVAIARGDEERLANDDSPLRGGDELLVVVRRADDYGLHDRLKGALDHE